MKITGNEPAYTYTEQSNSSYEAWNTIPGLTIRQQFAMNEMQGFDLLSDHLKETVAGEPAPYIELDDLEGGKDRIPIYGEPYIQWYLRAKSKYAVMQADALINALNQSENENSTPKQT